VQTRKKRESRDNPLPIRLTPTTAAEKRELMKLLTSMGISVSESKVLRKLAAPCFAPKLPYQQQPGVSTIYEPPTSAQLREMLGCRFFAWAVDGRLKPVIDTVLPLAETPRAYELLRSRKVLGKIIVVPNSR